MSGDERYLTDATGQRVPLKYVRAYDRKRNRIARRIAKEWQEMQRRLEALKARTLDAVAELQQAAAAEAGVPALGGKEGYIQFRSFDGRITVRVDNAKRTEFDERLKFAQELIHEALRELCDNVAVADLVEIATRAFTPRRSGQLDMQRIRDLKTYNVQHPKWRQAIGIINECERVIGHRRYIMVTVREGDAKEPAPVVLDIARL